MDGTAPAGQPRRPLRAALYSALLPGWGQLYAGFRRRGWLMLAVDAVLVTAAMVYLWRGQLELAKDWVRPGALGVMMLANLGLFGFRLVAARDAYQLAADTTPPSGATRFALGSAIVVVLVAPHAVFGFYDAVQYNLITSVFAADDVAATPSPTTTGSPQATPAPPVTVPSDAVTTSLPPPTSSSLPPAIWDGLDRLNILLVGGDAGAGRTGVRTDTMIVVSIDPVTGNTGLFSLPRNFVQVPLPAGHGIWECNCFPKLLNELYAEGIQRPDAFPGPGRPEVNAIKGGIGELLGIPIHYYALVSLGGFVGIVDALGGVEIDVPVRIVDETYPHEDGVTTEFVIIDPGVQVLDGHRALAYARIRRHADDYARMGRQRCVIDAVMRQSDPAELVVAYPRIAAVLEDSLQTDIPISRLDDFIDLLPKIDTERITSIRFIPPDYVAAKDERGKDIPDVTSIRHDVRVVLENSPTVARAILEIEPLEQACT